MPAMYLSACSPCTRSIVQQQGRPCKWISLKHCTVLKTCFRPPQSLWIGLLTTSSPRNACSRTICTWNVHAFTRIFCSVIGTCFPLAASTACCQRDRCCQEEV